MRAPSAYGIIITMIPGIMAFSLLAAPLAAPADVPAASPVYAGVALADAAASPDLTPVADAVDPTPTQTPLVSINTDILDMSWTGAMELSDPTLRPGGIVLPFLESYPIDNLEVKLRLLNVKF